MAHQETIDDTHIDTTLPYPDACSVVALCGQAGPCTYKVKARHQIKDNFLCRILLWQAISYFAEGLLQFWPFLWFGHNIAIEPTGSGAELSVVELIDPQDDGEGANTTRQLSSRNNSLMVSQQWAIIWRLEEMNINVKNEIAKL